MVTTAQGQKLYMFICGNLIQKELFLLFLLQGGENPKVERGTTEVEADRRGTRKKALPIGYY